MKTPNHLGIVVVREDVRDQRPALVRGERTIDQGFPRWNAVAMRGSCQVKTRVLAELKLTSRMMFSVRVDAGRRPCSNIVVSISIYRRSK